MDSFQRYHEAIKYLEGFTNLPLVGDYMVSREHPEIYLKRMRYFLELLGNPDKHLRFIHITGTAGKGSVTNLLHEMIRHSGVKVGSFMSPFVSAAIERVKVNDKYIGPDELADIVDELKPFVDQAYHYGPYGRPSHFELWLAIAFVYFQKQKCDLVVLEVGLGGRYDATNVIENPLVTAITHIDYDHTELLGKTLPEIAFDKVGIVKPRAAFFTAEQRPSLLKLFAQVAAKQKAVFQPLRFEEGTSYRERNQILASVIARSVGVGEEAIKQGIGSAKLPARFEIVSRKPLVIIDGAHNRSKMRTTAFNLQSHSYNKLYLVIATTDRRDIAAIFKEIVPLADSVMVTRFQTKDRPCAHPKKLWQLAKRYLKSSGTLELRLDPFSALDGALQKAKSGDVVLVTGSFFLAGELRTRWFPEEGVLKTRKSFH